MSGSVGRKLGRAAVFREGVCSRHYPSRVLDRGGSMDPIGYFILGTVLAVALVGTVGFLFAKLLERRLNSQKP